MLGSVRSKGACLRMREVRQASIFVDFLGLILFATGRPVGPGNAINGSDDASWWHLHFLYVWIMNIYIFHILNQKIGKIALRPMATLKSYNSGILKDKCKVFAPNRGISGSDNLTV